MHAPTEARPLYAQVKALIIQRLLQGTWRPGEALPNEFQLAADFGVSQGTVRKALDELAQENIVVRYQGKGTFVAEHTPHRSLFHFFRLVDRDGSRHTPQSQWLDCGRRTATPLECERLDLTEGAEVFFIRRLRSLSDVPALVETIVVNSSLLPDLDREGRGLNTLYDFYQSRYGVMVVKSSEFLSAVAATKEEAGILGVTPGHPLLQIDRSAWGLDGRIVEWRLSRCLTDRFRYFTELM